MHAQHGLGTFIELCLYGDYKNCLDIGSGSGEHAKVLRDAGLNVDTADFENATYCGDFNEVSINCQYDTIWCSHVLEHQLNVNLFLKKVHSVLKEGGLLAITVPPRKDKVVGGHVSLWNPGLLLYNLILAGFNCAEASYAWYDYNITCLVRKRNIDRMPALKYDNGDIVRLGKFFPFNAREGFDGTQPVVLNWPGTPNKLPKPRFHQPILQG